MSRDLVHHVIKPGSSEKELLALLGKPEQVSDRRGPGGNPLSGIHIYEYDIGHSVWLGMDDAFVYVHLDSSERVVQAEIYGY